MSKVKVKCQKLCFDLPFRSRSKVRVKVKCRGQSHGSRSKVRIKLGAQLCRVQQRAIRVIRCLSVCWAWADYRADAVDWLLIHIMMSLPEPQKVQEFLLVSWF